MTIHFITENPHKLKQYQELQQKLAPEMFDLVPLMSPVSEIQSVNGEDVVRDKMSQVRKTTCVPFFVDDVSLSVGSNMYPGALIKHLLKNNSFETLSQFLPDNAPVTLTCNIGYFDGFDFFVFKGEIQGTTCYASCDRTKSLGLDQLIEVNHAPLEKLDVTENHRGRAFQQFVKHLSRINNEREIHNAQVMERWNARANDWQAVREDATSYVNHEQGYARFDAEVKRILPLVTGSSLDIGCGDGDVTRLVASSPHVTDLLGIDISPEMIKTATEKTTDSRIQYRVGTSFEDPNRYGLITSRGVVLSHMHRSEVIPMLMMMAKSLAPNGYLIFDYISNLQNHDDQGRMPKNQLDREWIQNILSELGLVNVSYNGSNAQRVSILVFHKPTDTSLYFATSNATKVIELQHKCTSHVLHLANIDVAELKHDDIVEIAKDKAKKSYELLKRPVIVTDGGIFIHALKGFPGPNSKQAATLLGPKKLLALLEHETDRTASRRNCMVLYDGQNFHVCVAEVPLLISKHVTESDYHAYPMDAILIPVHDENPLGLTYKQMPVEQRVQFTELPSFERFLANLS